MSKTEKCFKLDVRGNNCKNEVKYYRKLDENPRPVCETHYNRMVAIEKRHYFKIETPKKVKCEFFDVCKENFKYHCRNFETLKESHVYCTEFVKRTNKQSLITFNEVFKKTIISFEIECTESGAKSLLKRLEKFLRIETNWAYKNLKFNLK